MKIIDKRQHRSNWQVGDLVITHANHKNYYYMVCTVGTMDDDHAQKYALVNLKNGVAKYCHDTLADLQKYNQHDDWKLAEAKLIFESDRS